MAQTGYTPILVYASGTASNVPLAANLTSSALGAELALNYADGKLYFKNSSGTVTLLASAAGSLGDVVGPASATDNALARFDLTTGKLIQNSVGILSDAGVLTGLTGLTSSGNITLSSLTSTRVPYASTGGLLVDSANLTFDGTTLTSTFAGPHNGTVGATTPNTGAFTTLSASSTVTLTGGTANGVAYLNGSKVLTTGSSLTWDGTNLTVNTGTVSATYGKLTVAGGISITPDSSSKFQIGRYSAGAPYSYIKMGSTSSGLKFTDPADSVDLAVLDSSGNLGLGVTPSAWSLGKAFEVGNTGNGLWGVGSGDVVMFEGGYYNSGWKYAATSVAAARYEMNAGVHQWYNAPSGTAGNAISFTQAMTLDASGNLGVGITSPLNRLDVRAASAVIGNYQTIQASSTDSAAIDLGGGIGLGGYYSGTASFATFGNIVGRKENATGGNYAGYLAFGTNAQATGVVERMRIDSSGNLLVGTTSAGGQDGVTIFGQYAAQGLITIGTTSAGVVDLMYFQVNGIVKGSISTNGTTTSFNTSSDYRLKNAIAPMTGALDKVALLKPCTYKWNSDGSDGQGFIAHELQEVIEGCVTGEKDAVDADGNPQYQGIDTSFLVATLTAAIQEQQALITTLTARITALEGA